MVITPDEVDRILNDAIARNPDSFPDAQIEAVREVGDHILDRMFQSTASTEIMAVLHGANLILAKGRWFLLPDTSLRQVGILLRDSLAAVALEIIGTGAAVTHQLTLLWDQLPNEEIKKNNWSREVLADISQNLTERLTEFQAHGRAQGHIIVPLSLLDIVKEAAPDFYALAVGDTAAKPIIREINQALEQLRTAVKVRGIVGAIDQNDDLPKN